jgi:hypothetical protein
MRALLGLLLMSSASAALANSEPVLGPVPAWVKRVPLNLPSDTTAAPVRMILLDEQIDLTPGAVSRYSEVAASVQTAAGLSAGNIGLSWRPDVDTIAVHALTILRKGKLIDVLASQKFTILRRETNLEDASLDGRLTATLLIDGVEVGDVINLASSVVTRDPTFANHVETSLARWNGATIDHAHARLHWSGSIPLRLRSSAGLIGRIFGGQCPTDHPADGRTDTLRDRSRDRSDRLPQLGRTWGTDGPTLSQSRSDQFCRPGRD